MFIDEIQLTCRAGKGGDGVVSWRREKYIPKGGPYGGNGGRGGNIVFLASPHENTLSQFRNKKFITAKEGEPGGTKVMCGAAAEDTIIPLPVGTLVTDSATGKLIVDLSEPGQTYLLCRGGRGGFGNAHFMSSTRQAPSFRELGDTGEEKSVKLELKLVADVGIVGLPNAGKSTLIQSVTNVRPKIANYPFTTIVPNLGVMEHANASLVLEDVPGLIEGASEGKGLGIQFLKHIERTGMLLHLVDLSSPEEDIRESYFQIRRELESFSQEIAQKEEWIVLTKCELVDLERQEIEKKRFEKIGKKVFVISAGAFIGLEALKDELIAFHSQRKKDIFDEKELLKSSQLYDLTHFIPTDEDKHISIVKVDERTFSIRGPRIEQIARMTDMSNPEGVRRVYDVLDKQRVLQKILKENSLGVSQEGFFEGTEDTPLPVMEIAGRIFPLEDVIYRRRG